MAIKKLINRSFSCLKINKNLILKQVFKTREIDEIFSAKKQLCFL